MTKNGGASKRGGVVVGTLSGWALCTLPQPPHLQMDLIAAARAGSIAQLLCSNVRESRARRNYTNWLISYYTARP